MKKISKLPFLFVVTAIILGACGEKKTETEEISVKKVNPEVEKHINALAQCEEQNTNCEAYKTTSEYIQAECKNEKKRDSIVSDLFTLIERGPSKTSQAAAHAVNFWTLGGDFRENPEYGKIVLSALLKEKDEEGNYTGQQLGQLLAGWLTTTDKDLYNSILDAIKNEGTEERGRMELIRLSPAESIANQDLFNILTGIIKDSGESTQIRVQALNVIWRVEDEDKKATVRSIYESLLTNSDMQISGTSLLGLGYIKSFASYDLIEKTLLNNKDNKDWCYYGSMSLNELIRNIPESLDLKKVFNLTKTLITNKKVDAYYRSYYVATLNLMNTADSKALLKELKLKGEKDIVTEINRVSAK